MSETVTETPVNLSAPVVAPIVVAKPTDVNEAETIGLTCSPTVLKNIISMIALPKSEKDTDFPKFVLNFDEDKIWWGNTMAGTFFLNFGFASANYFDHMWGVGAIALSSAKLLKQIDSLRSYAQVTFWANLKTKIYGVQASNVDKFTNFTDNIADIKSVYTPESVAPKQKLFPVKFGENYIPEMKEAENALIYGMDIEAAELRTIIDRGEMFSTKLYPVSLTKNGMTVSFNELFNPKDGAGMKQLIAKPGSEKFPTDDKVIEQILSSLIEGPAKNLHGPVTIRFATASKAPFCIIKKDKTENGGVLVSGYLITTKTK